MNELVWVVRWSVSGDLGQTEHSEGYKKIIEMDSADGPLYCMQWRPAHLRPWGKLYLDPVSIKIDS